MMKQQQQQMLAYQAAMYGMMAPKDGWSPSFRIGKPEVLEKAVRAEWVTETLAQHGPMTAQELAIANEVSATGYPVQDVYTLAIELGFGSAAEGFALPPTHPRKETP